MNCNGKCVKGGIHPDCPQHCKGEWRKKKDVCSDSGCDDDYTCNEHFEARART